MARTPRFTDKQIAKVLTACCGMITVSAERLHMDRSKLYKRIRASQLLQDTVTAARDKLLDTAEIALQKAVLDGEAWAVCFALKTIGKTRGYVERQELENTGPPINQVQVVKFDLSGFPVEALRSLAHAGDAGGAAPGGTPAARTIELDRPGAIPTPQLRDELAPPALGPEVGASGAAEDQTPDGVPAPGPR